MLRWCSKVPTSIGPKIPSCLVQNEYTTLENQMMSICSLAKGTNHGENRWPWPLWWSRLRPTAFTETSERSVPSALYLLFFFPASQTASCWPFLNWRLGEQYKPVPLLIYMQKHTNSIHRISMWWRINSFALCVCVHCGWWHWQLEASEMKRNPPAEDDHPPLNVTNC